MKKIFKTLTNFSILLLSFGMMASFALSFPTQISAQSAITNTPSSSSSSASDLQTTQNLKQRIDSVLKNRTDQVKGVMDEMTLQKRGFIGQVQRVIEQTITVKNPQETETLTLSPTVLLTKDGKKATIDDIAVDDWVVAVGYTGQQGFSLKHLFVSSVSLVPPHYDTTVGNVLSIAKKSMQLQPRSTDPQQQPEDYVLNKATKFEDAQGNALTQSDIQTDSQYLIVSFNNNDQKIVMLMHALGSGTAATTSP